MVARFLPVVIAAVLVSSAASGATGRTAHAAMPRAALASTLSVSGNHLVDNGQTVVLRGVNRSGSEYACYQGWGFFDGPSDDASVAAIAAWGVNVVRVPLNEDCWLGINGINPAYSGANYQAAITGFVGRLRAHGLYVILSNQVAGPGTTQSTTILPMPDADHAPAFWSSVAATFAGDKGVIFDLYNEPHDVSWSCWANGCQVTGGVNFVTPYQAAGMTTLTAAVRATGAKNVILIGGLSWSYDISGWLANRPSDTQLIAGIHNYGASGWDTPTIWNNIYAPTAVQVPVTFGEMGFDVYIEKIMPWADAHGIGYLAWTWDTWGNNEALISNYNGTPTTYGLGFKNYLASLTPAAPTVTAVAPNSGPIAGGTAVTITGTGFTNSATVKFGATAASSVTFNSATQITAVSPAATGAVDVTVSTAGGTSATNAADVFTYIAPSAYTSVAPVRLLDTRTSGGPLGARGSRNLTIAGINGVPAGATAVVLNVTVTNTTGAGYLTAYPTGAVQPLASNLNWVPGLTVANLDTVQLGTGGAVTFYNSAGSTDVVVDLEGYYAAPSGTAGGLVALTPSRITDTRSGSGLPNAGQTLGPASTVNVQVTGAGGVPTTGVSAVILNVTVTNTTGTSFLTVWPTGLSKPNASNLNWTAGMTVPNRVMVPIGAGGMVTVFNNAGSADVIVDVSGYFTDSTATGKLFTPISPVRIADTRLSATTLTPGGTMTVQVAGVAVVPSNATAVVLNVTVTNTTSYGYLTVYPSSGTRPLASDLNWVPGQTVPNLVLATLGATGAITFYNSVGSTDVVVDLAGWYA